MGFWTWPWGPKEVPQEQRFKGGDVHVNPSTERQKDRNAQRIERLRLAIEQSTGEKKASLEKELRRRLILSGMED